MTPDEIFSITEQDGTYPNERYGEITVPLLGVTVELVMLRYSPDAGISQRVADRLTALLALGPQDMPALAAALAKHCRALTNEYFDHIEYPSDTLPNAELHTINWTHYGLNADGTPPEGWANPEWLTHVTLMNDPERDGAELEMGFAAPWEEDHGPRVTVDAGGKIELL